MVYPVLLESNLAKVSDQPRLGHTRLFALVGFWTSSIMCTGGLKTQKQICRHFKSTFLFPQMFKRRLLEKGRTHPP
jgi:hypothetical protein